MAKPVDPPAEPSPPAAAAAADIAEERFWRKGAGAVDTGTLSPIPPEPGSTPAEMEEEGDGAEPVPDPAGPQ